MSSLESALDILSLFAVDRPAIGVSEAATELGKPKSSVSRIMKAMAEHELLERDRASRAYVPGVLAFQLGNLYHSNLSIKSLVDAAARELVEETGLTFYVALLSGREIVITDVFQGSYPIRLVLPKGARLPAHVTGIGLALLSRLRDDQLQALYPTQVDHQETNVSLTPTDIVKSAATVRDLGYAAVDGSAHRGFSAFAVAVNSPSDQQSVGFSLSYPSELAKTQKMEGIVAAILARAHEVGRRVGDPYWIKRAPGTVGASPIEIVMEGGEVLPSQQPETASTLAPDSGEDT